MFARLIIGFIFILFFYSFYPLFPLLGNVIIGIEDLFPIAITRSRPPL